MCEVSPLNNRSFIVRKNINIFQWFVKIKTSCFCKEILICIINNLETKQIENFAQFLYSDAIARILGWFLHLAIAFRVGSSISLPKNNNFHNSEYWDSLQHLPRSYAVLLQLIQKLLIKSWFLFRWDLFF